MIESTISHMKSKHRLEINFPKGMEGDRINAPLATIGYDLPKLLMAV